MTCTWTAPEAFGPAMLGAPFIAMQPEPSAGLRYSLFELSEPGSLLASAMSAIDGGAAPVSALSDFILALGDTMSLISGPLPGGPGTETQAIGPIFTPEAFDDSAGSRASQQAALASTMTARGDATRRSHASAMDSPAPAAAPSMAATVTFGNACSAPDTLR